MTKLELEDLYVNQKKSNAQIAREKNLTESKIRRLLAEFNIPTRGKKKIGEKSCAMCNSVFPLWKGSSERVKFCSPKCQAAFLRYKYNCSICNKEWHSPKPIHRDPYLCVKCSSLKRWTTKENETRGYKYIQIGEHGNRKSKPLHRIVAEQKYKRSLDKDEIIHHIDFNKVNNSEENLTITNNKDNLTMHHKIIPLIKWLLKLEILIYNPDTATYDFHEKFKKRNCAICKKCWSFIESKSVHDFVGCSCGAIYIDGGTEYRKCSGNPEDFLFLGE